MNKSSQSGLGLAEVIIGAGIGAVVIAGLTVSLRNSSEYQRKTESSIGRSVLEMDLSNGLNCNKTMEGRTMGAPCPKDQWIDLKSANGTVLVKADGSTQKGGWSIRALCRAGSPGSLDIRVAKLSKTGQTVAAAKDFAASNPSWFLRDEVSKQLSYSWNHPKAKLQSVCQQWFSGSSSVPSCSPSQVVKNVDLVAGTVTCADIPSCGADQALRWNGADFGCVDLPDVAPIVKRLNAPFSCYNTSSTTGAVSCSAGYSLTGCSIANDGAAHSKKNGDYADWDVVLSGNTCTTDDEEKSHNATLYITCCKIAP